MAVEIVVPRLGWSMDEGVFGQWLQREGDLVHEGDVLFELESDKATQEVESFDRGILRLPPDAPRPGDTVKVGQCLGYLCGPDEPLPPAASPAPGTDVQPPVRASAAPPGEATIGSHAGPATTNRGGARSDRAGDAPSASPSARRLARKLKMDLRHVASAGPGRSITEEDVRRAAETRGDRSRRQHGNALDQQPPTAVSPRAAMRAVQLGVPLADVMGTGRDGRIRERDVLAAARANAADQPSPRIEAQRRRVPDPAASPHAAAPLRAVGASASWRRTIAHRVLATSQQTAQVTLIVKADATELLRLRGEIKRACGRGQNQVPSMTALFVKLVAVALQHHPDMLRQWGENELVAPDGIHIAVAVDTEQGLVAPVVHDAASLPLGEITRQLRGLIERARTRQLVSDELQGGTFTVSNLGRYAVDGFTPILNLPQSALLGIGRIRREPAVSGDVIVIRDQVSLSLAFDHRVHDGAPAAAFLQTVCEFLEQPGARLIS